MKISIIVPCYNEENTILDILNKLSLIKNSIRDVEVIVIDDGSIDKTNSILNENKNLYNFIIRNSTNRGKGYSVKKALEICSGEYIFFQDADLEYDPNDIMKFNNLIDKFEPDLIIGSRFNYSDYTRSHNIFNKFGNFFITTLFNILYNTTFTDIYSCYACFKKKNLDISSLKTEGFEQHAEILCKVVKNGKKFYEVPINYNGRSEDEGKKIRFYHIFGVIFQFMLRRFIN